MLDDKRCAEIFGEYIRRISELTNELTKQRCNAAKRISESFGSGKTIKFIKWAPLPKPELIPAGEPIKIECEKCTVIIEPNGKEDNNNGK